MHTTQWAGKGPVWLDSAEDDDVIVNMSHNGDYSGEVLIEIDWARDAKPGDDPTQRIRVPFEALVELVGGAVLSKQIEHLEQRTAKEILGL